MDNEQVQFVWAPNITRNMAADTILDSLIICTLIAMRFHFVSYKKVGSELGVSFEAILGSTTNIVLKGPMWSFNTKQHHLHFDNELDHFKVKSGCTARRAKRVRLLYKKRHDRSVSMHLVLLWQRANPLPRRLCAARLVHPQQPSLTAGSPQLSFETLTLADFSTLVGETLSICKILTIYIYAWAW